MRTSSRLLMPVFASLALLIPAPALSGAKPNFAIVELKNDTRFESWVDFSTKNDYGSSWDIKKSFCLHPHTSVTERIVNSQSIDKILVRGEIKPYGCDRVTQITTYVEQDNAYHHNNFRMTIIEHGTSMKFGMRLDSVM